MRLFQLFVAVGVIVVVTIFIFGLMNSSQSTSDCVNSINSQTAFHTEHQHAIVAVQQAFQDRLQSVFSNLTGIIELLQQIQAVDQIPSKPQVFGHTHQTNLHVRNALVSVAKEVSLRASGSSEKLKQGTDTSEIFPASSSELFITQTSNFPRFFMSTLNPKQDKYIAPNLHNKGTWDPHILDLLNELVGDNCNDYNDHEPPIVVDVGANHGFFGLSAVAKGCRGIFVEPQPDLVHHIHLSLAMNPGFSERARVHNNIINDLENSDKELYIPLTGFNVGGRKVTNNRTSCANPGSCVRVTSVTVDEITGDQAGHPENILLLKIDCEGFESHVIRSATRLLHRPLASRVPFIIMELYIPRLEGGVRAAKEMLHTLYASGYLMKPVAGRTTSRWVRPENIDSFVDKWGNTFGDLFFVQATIIDNRKM